MTGRVKLYSQEWVDDCLLWRGRVLTGEMGHWCCEWDDLPVDETCPEWPCGCVLSEGEKQ